MMRNLYWKEVHRGILKWPFTMMLVPVVLVAMGCGSGDDDGQVINQVPLQTGTTLDLYCADEGIYLETCVLDDPRNPFATTVIIEFDPNDEDAENKFELFAAIPPEPEYALSRFYFWATALARRSSGENQYYTARALYELWSYSVDEGFGSQNAQNQAIRAYRAVLDYYFGSVTFFSTCDFLPCPPNPETFYSIIVSDLTGQELYNPPTGFSTLYPSDSEVLSSFLAKEAMSEWGFTYDIDNRIVFVNMF
ncbi:MAG: hypothetical protein WBN81_08040 [Gammaproteobacteria bacterium]